MREVINLAQLSAMEPDEAAALLAARLLDPTGDHDAIILDDWLRADSRHADAWLRVQTALASLDGDEGDESGADAWQDLRDEALRLKQERPRQWARWSAAAAAIALVLGGLTLQIGGLLPWSQETAPENRIAAADDRQDGIEYATTTALRTVDLADGSTVTLDAGSTVRVAYTAEQRRLTLVKGRAFFAVERDPKRPFAVEASGSKVVALGTQFDVDLLPSGFSVTLFEGRVGVDLAANAGQRVTLEAGNRLLVQADGAITTSPIDPETPQGWRKGFATFHDTPLAHVVEELNRYTQEQLVIRDPAIANLRISGNFRTGDPRRFARTISQVYPIRVERRGDGQWEVVASGKQKK